MTKTANGRASQIKNSVRPNSTVTIQSPPPKIMTAALTAKPTIRIMVLITNVSANDDG